MAKTNKKNNPNSVGGISREKVMLAAGYLLGLSLRPDPVLDAADREMIKNASKALRGACTTLWPEWFKD